MAVNEITNTGVELALNEFNRTGLDAMLAKYGGGPSRKWYVEVGNWRYDQKLLIRAAHVHEGLGKLPLRGPGRFHAHGARRQLTHVLGYRVLARIGVTDASLASPKATEPLARWLIGAGKHHTTLTYGEAAHRLERECGFGRIFPAIKMGVVVGQMQYEILRLISAAPLLNLLLVRKDTGKPGDGAREFLAGRFPNEVRLREKNVRTEHRGLWSDIVARATDEVYQYGNWEVIYEGLFGNHVPDPYYAEPTEDNRIPSNGGGGEGPNHTALRLWVMNHPELVSRRFRSAAAETEKELLSGDRVDVVYFTENQMLAIEVKSRDSNWNDLRRGIYQCIKYRAVLHAQERGGSSVHCLLVTERELPLDLIRLAKELEVKHLHVNPSIQ